MAEFVFTLRKALDRERLQCSLSQIAADAEIDTGNLSQFATGKRGLSAVGLERLSGRLGVRVTLRTDRGIVSGPLLTVIRSALHASKNSIRAIAYHTRIDPGNLSRFVGGRRIGLSMDNIETLCRYLKLVVEWSGRLQVEVLRERKVGDAIPIPGATVECFCLGNSGTPVLDVKAVSDVEGVAIFDDVPIGSVIQVTVNGLRANVEMIENTHTFSFVV